MMEKSRRDLLGFFKGVLQDHLDDPEVIAHEPIEEVAAYLQDLGLEDKRILREVTHIEAESEGHNVVKYAHSERGTPTSSRRAWFGPLSLFPSLDLPTQAVAGAASDDAPPSADRADVFKEVELDELLDYAGAKQTLPWIGQSIRVSRTTGAADELCSYVVSIAVDRTRLAEGALLVSLRSDEGTIGEVTLKRDAPAAMTSGPGLPADWRRITISAAPVPH